MERKNSSSQLPLTTFGGFFQPRKHHFGGHRVPWHVLYICICENVHIHMRKINRKTQYSLLFRDFPKSPYEKRTAVKGFWNHTNCCQSSHRAANSPWTISPRKYGLRAKPSTRCIQSYFCHRWWPFQKRQSNFLGGRSRTKGWRKGDSWPRWSLLSTPPSSTMLIFESLNTVGGYQELDKIKKQSTYRTKNLSYERVLSQPNTTQDLEHPPTKTREYLQPNPIQKKKHQLK